MADDFVLYPAIDLKDGDCVRLAQGEMDQATVFSSDPGAQAAEFQAAGAKWLHIVDLNGAFAGQPVNAKAVADILANVKIPVQLGGGIRTMDMIETWLDAGIARVILGTAALRDPCLVISACQAYPDKIAVGIDARDGMAAVSGWAETSNVSAVELGKRFEDAGVAAIIHTDIARDGVLAGPNTDASAQLADAVSIPVIVSGGVASLDDVLAVHARRDEGLSGVISGRAIYDGRLNITDALAKLAEAS